MDLIAYGEENKSPEGLKFLCVIRQKFQSSIWLPIDSLQRNPVKSPVSEIL